MDLGLKNKRALVTGSSGGIGEAIAKTLAAEGVAVVVHGRKKGEAQRVVKEIEAAGGRAALALGDLARDEEAERVADAALAAFGGVDILVNNAGSYPLGGWLQATPGDWVRNFESNVFSAVRLIRRLAPPMKDRGWGRIIQIASIAGVQPAPPAAAYSATKAAMINMTVSLARELDSTGVTVNTVSPGPIVTGGWNEFALQLGSAQGWGNDLEEIKKRLLDGWLKNPSGRIGQPEDIADLVAFVASPRAGFVNGANLRVDGGMVPTVN